MDTTKELATTRGRGKRTEDFVETPTAELVLSALGYAKAHGDVAIIYGGPGLGKTSAIERFASAYDDVWVTTVTPACATVAPMLGAVAAAVGLGDLTVTATISAHALERKIAERIRGVRGLLIVDEAQHLKEASIEELRSIHDAAGCGMAFVGNEAVFARFHGTGRDAAYAQIYSRVGMRLHLERPTTRDLRALLKSRWSVDDAEIVKLLEPVVSRPGALRLVVKVMRMAAARGGAVTASRVADAIAHLGASEAAR